MNASTRPTPVRPPSPKPAPPPKPASPSKASSDDQTFAAVDELRADLACAVAPVPSIGRAELGSWAVALAGLLAALGDRDPWLRFRLSLARRRVDELLKTPARGPVGPPAATGKGPTPGPAVAVAAAACGSDGSLVGPVAGASSGRGGEVPGSEPARPGRSSLRLRPAIPLGVGPLYDFRSGVEDEMPLPTPPSPTKALRVAPWPQNPTPPPPPPHPQKAGGAR